MLTGGGVILSNHRVSCQKTVWSDGRDARKLNTMGGELLKNTVQTVWEELQKLVQTLGKQLL